jgi:hypothetical protein
MLDTVDRLFQADTLPPVGMPDMAGMQAEQPELAEEEVSHPSLLPENNRILLKSIPMQRPRPK